MVSINKIGAAKPISIDRTSLRIFKMSSLAIYSSPTSLETIGY